MNAPLTRLPYSWVESLLSRMLAIYGQKFRSQWADVPPEQMREAWAVALARYDGERIRWALEQMVATCPWPPTLPEFRALCQQAPRPEAPPALPEPPLTPQAIAERQAGAEAMARKVAAPRHDHRAWARKLRKKWLAGHALGMQQVEMGSDAMGEAWGIDERGKRYATERVEAQAA